MKCEKTDLPENFVVANNHDSEGKNEPKGNQKNIVTNISDRLPRPVRTTAYFRRRNNKTTPAN